MSYQSIKVRFEEQVCFIQLYRPEANNTINDSLLMECTEVLNRCEKEASVVVLEGLPEVFCFGADFKGMSDNLNDDNYQGSSPEPLYDLWMKFATGPYVTVAHVRGKANAGGMGFVAACDIVLADHTATFSLSELLFGLLPACVMPFLIRKIGFQKAQYLTLMTSPIKVQQALEYGLVDAVGEKSSDLLRRYLLRLKKLPKAGIEHHKRYMLQLDDCLVKAKPFALRANEEVFSNTHNLESIRLFVEEGKFPWEAR